jgi:hypothetical protein
LFVTTEALPILRLGMKRMLISLCLSGAVISPPTALDFSPAPNLHGDDVISVAIIGYGSSSSPLQSTEIVALPCEQDEVHAVVVDMPQGISLAYASPETWGSLSMPVEPYEQPPATPGFQLATNAAILTVSN